MEYIIQLDPQTLDALKAGETIQSDIPPSAGNVRSYRIILGKKKLPRINSPATSIGQPSTKIEDNIQAESPKTPESTAASKASLSPRTFSPDTNEKPLAARSAAFVESDEKPAKSAAALEKESASKEEESAKPWMPLILASLGLFASFGGNMYLAWIFIDLRRRYRSLLVKAGVAGV